MDWAGLDETGPARFVPADLFAFPTSLLLILIGAYAHAPDPSAHGRFTCLTFSASHLRLSPATSPSTWRAQSMWSLPPSFCDLCVHDDLGGDGTADGACIELHMECMCRPVVVGRSWRSRAYHLRAAGRVACCRPGQRAARAQTRLPRLLSL